MVDRCARALMLLILLCCDLAADEIQYVDRQGQLQTLQGRIYASDSDRTVLLQDDGSLKLVPSTLLTRQPSDESPALTAEQALERLQAEFGTELFRGTTADSFVVGVVLQAPVPEKNEARLQRALEKSAGYMGSIEQSFDRFMKSLNVPVSKPEFPLTLLIFESDDEFEEYSNSKFGRSGPFAEQVKGFYSNLTNVLYVRMSECASFDTPLHEAIHQLCFNKGLFQRLAPIPTWLAEGMACSFEGGGTTTRGNPLKLNSEYAAEVLLRLGGNPALQSNRFVWPGWDTIVAADDGFHAPDAGSVAYIDSWSLHWILVSKYKEEFAEYLKYVQTLEPLDEIDEAVRLQQFQTTFGATPSSLWGPFRKNFDAKARNSRAVRRAMEPDGVSRSESHLAAVSMYAARDAGSLFANGELKNISPFREMAYYVCVQTDGNHKVQWFLPSVRMGKVVKLRRQRAPVAGTTFRVFVRSAPAESPTAAAWATGRVPAISNRAR